MRDIYLKNCNENVLGSFLIVEKATVFVHSRLERARQRKRKPGLDSWKKEETI